MADELVAETLQISSYDAAQSPNQFYDWHSDRTIFAADYNREAASKEAQEGRLFTVSVQLSAATEYTGGAMRVGASTVGRELGTAVIYDAFTLHTVNPIETGVRHSLVCATQIVFLPDYLSCNFITYSAFKQHLSTGNVAAWD